MPSELIPRVPKPGPWLGTNENLATCDPGRQVLRSLNVVFDDGAIRRRKGRVRLAQPATIRPSRILSVESAGSGAGQDEVGLVDGDKSTQAVLIQAATEKDAISIGCPFPFCGLKFYISTPIPIAIGTLSVVVGPISWTALEGRIVIAPTIDTTKVGGNSMKQTGAYYWRLSDLRYWRRGTDGNGGQNVAWMTDDLYWATIVFEPFGADVGLAEVEILFDGSTETPAYAVVPDLIRGSVNGAARFLTRGGDELVVVASDFPGTLNDPVSAGLDGLLPHTRAWYIDESRGDAVPLRIPTALTEAVPRRRHSFASFFGNLIGSDSAGRLYRFDGELTSEVEAIPGRDQARDLPGAKSYLASPPSGRHLTEFQDALVVANLIEDPLGFAISLEDNQFGYIPDSAPLGGANVWPYERIASIPANQGDEITGAFVIGRRLCLPTLEAIWTVDDTSPSAPILKSDSSIGCIAPASLVRVGESHVFYLSRVGLTAFDGSASSIVLGVDGDASDLFGMVNWQTVYEDAVAIHDPRLGEYRLWLPIRGEPGNRVCLCYDYKRKSYRLAAGWLPFDSWANEAANGHRMQVCGALVRQLGGRERVFTIEADGSMWLEDEGQDDNGVVFPAYALFVPQASALQADIFEPASHQKNLLFSEVDVEVLNDGADYMCLALRDGDDYRRELALAYYGGAARSQIVRKQALGQDGRRNIQIETWGAAVWGSTGDLSPRWDRLKVSFRARGRRLQLAVLMSGFVSGGATSPARGGIRGMEFQTEREAGRP